MRTIELMNINTDDPAFDELRDVVLNRHQRLVACHRPSGTLTYMREASGQERTANAFMPVILDHTQTIAGAFRAGLYASAFALVRPTMEGLLKQALISAYTGNDDGWKDMINEGPRRRADRKRKRRIRVTKDSVRKLGSLPGWPDFSPLWEALEPWLNEFAHGGASQLRGNHDVHRPKYPAHWFYDAMLICTTAALSTSAAFWAHLGHDARGKAAIDDLAATDWSTFTFPDGRHDIKIVKP